jgi:TonB-linked SusC/RagA family outer membrane protein
MKKIVFAFCCFLVSTGMAVAQNKPLSGVVLDEVGEPVIGASVFAKGTTTGTATDNDGRFSFNAPANVTTLVVKYVGYADAEVSAGVNLRITIRPDVKALDEIVVTALGISREKKSLGYAVQEVNAGELTKAGQLNVTSSLMGKVAGVQISSAGGQVGSSQRIVIRGNSSLGSNEPLIVVDGIPVANDQYKKEEVDFGSGLNDINPEDIESISVLKGGSAALYGMRAGNGVILITTKSGKKTANGVQVQYSGHFNVDQIYNIPKMQNKYGEGYEGSEYDYSLRQADGFTGSYQDFASAYGFAFGGVNGGADESWGPRLDVGLKLPQVNSPIVDGVRQATPWVSYPDNIKELIQTGHSMNHNISITSLSDVAMTRVSLALRDQVGTWPNTDEKRYSGQVNSQMKLGKQFDFDYSMNYTRTESKNIPQTGYKAGNVLQAVTQWFGRQVNMQDMKEKWETVDPTTDLPYSWNPEYHQNPYYTLYKNVNPYKRNRLFGKSSLFYKPLESLKFEGRVGYDYFDLQANTNRVYTTDEPDGWFRQYGVKQTELNADLIAYFNHQYGDFSVNAFGGANYRDFYWETTTMGANMLTVPGLFTMSNIQGSAITDMDHRHERTNSVYASGSLGYRSMAYVDVSARNDWSSTIADPFFYPSVSLSWIPTASFEDLRSDALNFLKIRGNWAKIGSATEAYKSGSYYGAETSTINGNSQFHLPYIYPPKGLRPESVVTAEVGLEAQLFNSRIGLDIAYYNKTTTDQIMEVATSRATGYRSMLINAGEISNKGLEIQLRAKVIEQKDLQWNLSLNWSRDVSKIIELYTDPSTGQSLEQFQIGAEWSTYVYARPGESWGTIYGAGMYEQRVKDANGNIALDANGNEKTVPGVYVVAANGTPRLETKKLGSVAPDWLAGLNSELTYKDFTFGLLFDYRHGGDIFSVSTMWGAYSGVLDFTAEGDIRERAIIVGVDVLKDMKFVNEDGSAVTATTNAHDFFNSFYLNRQLSVFDGTYLKLRETYLTYTFPKSLLQNQPYIKGGHLSLIANNVAILYLHGSNRAHFDPETAKSSDNAGVGLEVGAYQPTRSMGIKLGLTF